MSTESGPKADVSFKLLLIGDSCVGKTSLLIRFKDRIFLKGSYISTVGIDYKNKMVTAGGLVVRLQIWDTAGQEKFHSITKAYYRDTDAIILVYDLGRTDSFLHAKSWLSEVSAVTSSKTLIALVGNKTDEENARVVTKQAGELLAKETGALFYETSAKTGFNVDNLFHSVTETLVQSRKPTADNRLPGVPLETSTMDNDNGGFTTRSQGGNGHSPRNCCSWS